jgi:histone H3/H4
VLGDKTMEEKDTLIIKSKVKAYLKEKQCNNNPCRLSGNAAGALTTSLKGILDNAAGRARGNGRVTVMVQDLLVPKAEEEKESLIVKSKVKAYLKEKQCNSKPCRLSGSAENAATTSLKQILDNAAERARGNGRVTVMVQDL